MGDEKGRVEVWDGGNMRSIHKLEQTVPSLVPITHSTILKLPEALINEIPDLNDDADLAVCCREDGVIENYLLLGTKCTQIKDMARLETRPIKCFGYKNGVGVVCEGEVKVR